MKIALLCIDAQGSFMAGGELAVQGAEEIIPAIQAAAKLCDYRIMTRDFHDPKHSSFLAQGGPWPPHGIAGTPGAQLHPAIDVLADLIISKGTKLDKDGYSGFADTNLAAILDSLDVDTLILVGLATEVCVLNTGLDALDLDKYQVIVLTDAVRAVELTPGDGLRALEKLQNQGALLSTSQDLPGLLLDLAAQAPDPSPKEL